MRHGPESESRARHWSRCNYSTTCGWCSTSFVCTGRVLGDERFDPVAPSSPLRYRPRDRRCFNTDPGRKQESQTERCCPTAAKIVKCLLLSVSGSVQVLLLAMSSLAQDRNTDLWLVPVVMTKTPVTVSAVKSARTVPPEARSVVAIARADHNAYAHRRWHIDWTRWRRVIVTGRGSSVRLNHICARVRAQSSSKHECQHRQCHHETFLSHDRRVPPVVLPI